jgi:CRP/FNR family transcriptional regulator
MYALLEDFPEMEKRLLATAGNELVAAQEQMLLLGRKTAREKLASFLLGCTVVPTRQPSQSPDLVYLVALPMTRNDIADYLGLTVETVSRTFGVLKRAGLIAIPAPSRVTIRNPAALRRLAAGEG